MEHEKKTIRTIEVLSASGRWVREARGPLTIIIGFGLLLPNLLINTLIDVQGSETANLMRLIEIKQLNDLVDPTSKFLSIFGPAILGWVTITVASYLALIHLIFELQLGRSQPSGWAALKRGLRIAFPRGLILLLILIILVGAGQILLIPAVAIAVLSTMAPIIMVAEGKGSWRSIKDALFLRYIRSSQISGWGIFSTLLYLSGLYYVTAIGIYLLNERLLELDFFSNISRQVYISYFRGLPFGVAYFAISCLTLFLEQLTLATLAVATTTLYVLLLKSEPSK